VEPHCPLSVINVVITVVVGGDFNNASSRIGNMCLVMV